MSESTPSVCKTVSWILAILLIGVVALYTWHNENQGRILADKDAQIAQSAQLLAATEQKQEQLAEASGTLAAEKQRLAGELDAANQANQKLKDDMKALEATHARAITAEREQARQAYAELQGRHDAANERIASLGRDIEQLKREMADAVAKHEARMAQTEAAQEKKLSELAATHRTQAQHLEQKLNERIDYYRTALEGSDPERAAQLADLEVKIRNSQQAIAESRQAVEAIKEIKTGLEEKLANANRVISERDLALSETTEKLENLQAELKLGQSAVTTLRQKHEVSMAKATEAHAKLQQELQAANAAHEKTKTEAAAAMQAVKEDHAGRMAEAERRISDLTGRLQAKTTALGILRQKHSAVVAELRGSLDATEQTLAGVKAELSATKETADQARQRHEQRIAEAQSTIDSLQQSLEKSRQQAARDLKASERECGQTLAYVRGIYREFSKLGGRQTDQGMLLSLAEDDLRFRISKADLPKGGLASLDRIAELLVEHPKLTARIEGHTDNKGRDETNLELSQQRADAVKQALIERGVDAQRMTAEGIGENRPIADNARASGRRKNRRVEIYVMEN